MRLALVAAVIAAAHGAIWTELGTLDCGGNIHLANQNDFLSTDANIFSKLLVYYADHLVNTYRTQAKCRCPQLTDTQLQQKFTPGMELLLRAFDSNAEIALPAACADSFDFSFDKLHEQLRLPLPSTCTLTRWLAEQKCEFEYPVAQLDLTLQVSIHACNNRLTNVQKPVHSAVPYVSVSCKGDTCEDMWKLCDNDNECAGDHKCSPLRVQHQEYTYGACTQFQGMCLDRTDSGSCSCQGDPTNPFTICECTDPDNGATCDRINNYCVDLAEDGTPVQFRRYNDAEEWLNERSNGRSGWYYLYTTSNSYVGQEVNDELNDAFLDLLHGPRWFNASDSCPAYGAEVGRGVADKLFEFFASKWSAGQDTSHSSGLKFCGLEQFGLTLTDQEMLRTQTRHEVENPFKFAGCGDDNPSLEAVCPCRFNETLRDQGGCACDGDNPCPNDACDGQYFWQTCQGNVSPFSTWDGVLPGGLGAASSPTRRSGAAFTQFETVPQASNEQVLLRHSCNEQFSIFPNNDVSARINFPDFPALIDHFSGIVRTLAECRNGGAMSDQLFSALNWPFDLTFPLHLFTQGTGWQAIAGASNRAYETFYSTIKDLLDENADYVPPQNGDGEKLGIHLPEMPSTCTLTKWLTDGECSFEWDGFSELLHDDVGTITLRVKVKRCSQHPLGIPEATISCVGSKCVETFQFWRLDYCQADNECQASSSGAQRNCNDFAFDAVKNQNTLLWNPFARTEQSSKFQFAIKPGADTTSLVNDAPASIVALVHNRGSHCAGFSASRLVTNLGTNDDGQTVYYLLVKPETEDGICHAYEVEHALRNFLNTLPIYDRCVDDSRPSCGTDPRAAAPWLDAINYDLYNPFWDRAVSDCAGGCPSDDQQFCADGWRDCRNWEWCEAQGQYVDVGTCTITDTCINYRTMMQHVLDFVGIVTGTAPKQARACPANDNCHGICDPHIVAMGREVTSQDSDAWIEKYFRTADGKKGTLNGMKATGTVPVQNPVPTSTNGQPVPTGTNGQPVPTGANGQPVQTDANGQPVTTALGAAGRKDAVVALVIVALVSVFA